MALKPKTEAVALRIYAYCNPRGWNVTLFEVAEALGEPIGRIKRVLVLKGWTRRLRATRLDIQDNPYDRGSYVGDCLIDGLD